MVYEPSFHDSARRPDGTLCFDPDEPDRHPNGFHVKHDYDTTVRDAVLRAEREPASPVTIYVHDKGAGPLG